MSVCAIVVLLALGPVLLGPIQSEEKRALSQGLDELVDCFEEVAECPGEVRMEIEVGRFLEGGSGRFLVREGSLWAFADDQQLARSLPPGLHLYEVNEQRRVEVQQLQLLPSHMLVIEGRMSQGDRVIEAHIENLRATSATFSANLSASLSVL